MSLERSGIARVVRQPDFPEEDILPNNAEIIRLVLEKDPGVEGQARLLWEHQAALFYMAANALLESGVRTEWSQTAFYGFTSGYSMMELLIMYVRGHAIDIPTAARRAGILLPTRPFRREVSFIDQFDIEPTRKTTVTDLILLDDLTDTAIEDVFAGIAEGLHEEAEQSESEKRANALVERYVSWPERQPNLYELVQQHADSHFGNAAEMIAAIIGAQIAAELQCNPAE